MQNMQDYEQDYDAFWKGILENHDGTINMDQLKRELFDFRKLMNNAAKVYEHITGGTITKVETNADAVISVADSEYGRLADAVFGPHKDYDFVNHDKVFVENSDGGNDYFELYYEQDAGGWILVPYTDKYYTTPKEVDGNVTAEEVSAYGYDLLQRCEDFNIDELN
jgi:hypothetical protein